MPRSYSRSGVLCARVNNSTESPSESSDNMPPLVVFGRSWEFGSDDLVFPFLTSGALHTFWLLIVISLLAIFHEDLSCGDVHNLVILSYATVAIFVIIIITAIAIVVTSGRGTIANPTPRWPIPYLLYFRVSLYVCQALLLVTGTVFAFTDSTTSSCVNFKHTVLLLRLIMVSGLAVLLILLSLVMIYIDPCHCYRARVDRNSKDYSLLLTDDGEDDDQQQGYHSVWEKRCNILCCVAGRDRAHRNAYKELSTLFAQYFQDVNLVASDIAAGFVLLQRQQLAEEKERIDFSEEDLCGVERCLDFNNDVDRECYRQALHYCNYALGCYTWPLLCYVNPTTALCQLGQHIYPSDRVGAHHRQRQHVLHDNSCFCNLSGLLEMAKIEEEQIVYCSFRNNLFCIPFYVAIDYDNEAVVIAMRGTLSLHDVVTDMVAVEEEIEGVDVTQDQKPCAHKGILRTAHWVREVLKDKEILETAFSRGPNYKLIIVGHSLGAGCAAILATLLRQDYPHLHCFAYSPPGCLNEAAACYTKEFVTSVTLGKDLVARFGLQTAISLKDDIVSLLRKCRKPKYRILVEGVIETLTKCIGRTQLFDAGTDDNVLEETPLVTSSPSQSLVHSKPLLLPGRIIHIRVTDKTKKCLCSVHNKQAYWVTAESFLSIKVSPEMIRDHFPNVLYNNMESLWKQHCS